MKKKKLKSENQIFKDESHPSFKRLNDLINSECKSSNKIAVGFVDGNTTPSSGKIFFIKPCREEHPKKTHSQTKFHCTRYGKMGHTFFINAMQECLIIFNESWKT